MIWTLSAFLQVTAVGFRLHIWQGKLRFHLKQRTKICGCLTLLLIRKSEMTFLSSTRMWWERCWTDYRLIMPQPFLCVTPNQTPGQTPSSTVGSGDPGKPDDIAVNGKMACVITNYCINFSGFFLPFFYLFNLVTPYLITLELWTNRYFITIYQGPVYWFWHSI